MYFFNPKHVNYFLISMLIFLFNGCDIFDSSTEIKKDYFNADYIPYMRWHQSSIPVQIINSWNIPAENLMNFKSNVYWYNIYQSPISIPISINNVTKLFHVPALYLAYSPEQRACYNTNLNYSVTDTSWGGVMTPIISDDADQLVGKFDRGYLSIWVRYLINAHQNYLFIDLGRISEDVIPNLMMNSEDINANERLETFTYFDEDRGLDELINSKETYFDEQNNPDPNNDDFSDPSITLKYEKINFPEKNNILDSEDLNNNWTLDRTNQYYTYKVPLDSANNKYLIEKSSDNRWMKLQIPLIDYFEKIGDQNDSEFSILRFWFKDCTETVRIEIAEIKFSFE